MTISRLVIKEIFYRKTGFLLALLSVSMAMTAWMGSLALLRANDLQTDRILAQREQATQQEMIQMEDDYRLIMRDLGHNVMILASGQDMAELRARGYPDKTIPYEYAERLARGGVKTLNHILPVLQQRVVWPEHEIEIILSGTPGQTPIPHRAKFLTADGLAYQDPIMETVPPGELVLGHDVARALGLRPGDKTTLMGKEFLVRDINPPEGTTDDIAVWCHLHWMQEQLGMEGKINLILALECVCHAESIGIVVADVNRLLPDVDVMEFSSRVKARALARARAGETHRVAMEAERKHRMEVAAAQERFAGIMAPLVVAGSVVWMVFLFFGNARERKVEIAILRAVGLSEKAILVLFLIKSVAIGLAGAVIGFLAGHVLAVAWSGLDTGAGGFVELLRFRLLAAALIAAPAFCALAAWLPALMAIREDPAKILCEA